MNRDKEPARQCGNTSGPVMGGINLAVYQVELIPYRIQFSDVVQRQAAQEEQQQAGSSAEKHVEQASSEDHSPAPGTQED